MRRLTVALAFASIPAVSGAQVTQELIDKGIANYTSFQVDAARIQFQQVVSPSWQSPVSDVQKVTALKYLGASYAVLGNPDSAQIFFSAALEFDAFTDLEQEKFSASELGPFQLAKLRVFNIGVRPVYSAVVNPRNDSTAYRFILVSTHRANLTVELIRQPDSTLRETLFSGQSDGVKEIRWDGFMRGVGRIADSANYMLRIKGTSLLPRTGGQALADEETDFLKIEHSFDPLEDTLPALPDSLLLKPSIPSLAPWQDLGKGIGFGAAAYGLAAGVLSGGMSFQSHAILAAGVSVVSGVGSWFYRSRNRAIPENVAENASRQRQRQTFNDGVRARNTARIAQTQLIITPITGVR